MAETVETAIYRLQIEGEEKIKSAAQAVELMATRTEDATASNRRLTTQIERGIASYDAVIKAQNEYNRALELNARAREAGANSAQKLDAHEAIIAERYQAVTKAANEAAIATENLRRAQANAAAGPGQAVGGAAGAGIYVAQLEQAMANSDAIAREFGDKLTARLVPELKKTAHISGAAFVSAFEEEASKAARIAQLKAEQAGQNFQRSLNEHFGIDKSQAYVRGAAGKGGSAFGDVETGAQGATAHVAQLGNATKVARYEMINLGRQANDVFVSLASGMNPIMVIIQQGSQVLDVFTSSQRTAGELFKQMGTAITGFVTNPLTIAVGLIGGATVATLALANAWDKVNVSAQRAISGAGARTGTTVSDINKFVETNTPSAFTGAGLSQKESRALAEGLTQTGDIVISKLRGMSDAVMGFSNQTKKSMDEAVKSFIEFGKDPKKAMDDLTAAFGPLGNKTRDMVEHYLALGDKTSAFNVLLDATAKKANEAANNMGFLEKAGRGVVNALQTPGQRSTGLEKDLEKTRQELNALIESAERWAATGQKAPAELAKAIELVSRAFEKLSVRQQDVINTAAGDVIKNIEDKARAATEALIPQNKQIEEMTRQLNELKAAQAAGVGGPDLSAAITAQELALQKTRETKEETARANEYTKAIAASWGTVSVSVGVVRQDLQQQLALAQALTGQQRMAAQAAIDYTEAMRQGKGEILSAEIAAGKLKISHAAATTSVKEQIHALEQSTELIKAQENGTEATVKAAQAYENAIRSGADATSAAALSAATLANEMTRAAAAANALQFQRDQASVDAQTAQATQQGSYFKPDIMPSGPLSFVADPRYPVSYKGGGGRRINTGAEIAVLKLQMAEWEKKAADELAALGGPGDYANRVLSGGGSVDAAIAAAQGQPGATSTLSTLYNLKNSQTLDRGTQIANDQQFLSWLQGQPQTIENLQAISSLTSEIQNLANSTDSLNATNQELLSPYYTQDPRTSHIGFRSQGMAGGGYVDVPGGYSANDNMLAMVPVASGERIYVDPMSNRRGTGSGGMTINISSPITINGNASADQFGRTLYQSNQSLARQVRSAAQ